MTNLFPQTFFALLAIPQAFPQHANPAQLASPKVLTSQNYRDSCTHSAACRIRTRPLTTCCISENTAKKRAPFLAFLREVGFHERHAHGRFDLQGHKSQSPRGE